MFNKTKKKGIYGLIFHVFGVAEFVVHVLDKTIARCVDITGTKTFQNANIHVS